MWRLINLTLAGLLLALIFVWREFPDDNLHLIACDVGQGDGLLLIYKDQQILVDAGPDDSILSCLGENMPFWDREIEAAVITHPQTDHMTGMVAVFNSYEVKQLMVVNFVNDIDQFWVLKELVLKKNTPVKELLAGDVLKIGLVELTVLWPKVPGGNKLAWKETNTDRNVILGAQTVADPNIFSTVLLGRFGKSKFLLTGDIDTAIEKQLVSDGVGEVDVLKVAHHGSKYSTSETFLTVVKPKVGIISVGEKNRFGHPTTEVLQRLAAVGAKIFRTDELGDIKLSSNGEAWMIE